MAWDEKHCGRGFINQIVKNQACYDGALGARSMHNLQSYGEQERIYDDNDGTLKIYTIPNHSILTVCQITI